MVWANNSIFIKRVSRQLAHFGLVIASFLLIAGSPSVADHMTAPPDYGRPLRVGLSDSFGIEYAWKAILKEADIAVLREEVSHARRRRMFIEGFILIDCCVTPEWRNTPEDNAVQLFTDVFYKSEEVYLFREGESVAIDKPEDLKALRVAVIQGFTYENAKYFGSTIPGVNIASLFKLIEMRRAQVTIISKVDFLHHMALKPRPLVIRGIDSVVDLRIRVHKSRADLLPRLNAAIKTLKEKGVLKDLIENP